MIHKTLSFIFDDIRKDNGLEGIVSIYAKMNNDWLGVFRYELEKQSNGSLKTKVAKVITFNPNVGLDEQFRYELTYFTKEIFPKTFLSKVNFAIPNNVKIKMNGFATQPKVDEKGNMVLDEKGKPIMESKQFQA